MKSSPSSHLLFRPTLLSMKEILYRFQAFNLFCFVFVFFFNFRSHSPLPFIFSRTRVCISIFYVMKIVYLSTFSGMREIRNSWKGRALLTRLPDLFKSLNKSSASFDAELTTALCVVV